MNKTSLLVIVAGVLVSGAGRSRAADANATAYTALRAMGKSLGQDAISRVVEVTGQKGKPQPDTWRIVILDPSGGPREIMVTGGRIVSQNPVRTTAASPIRLQDLNLDSSGAFDAADAEARKAKVPFTALDYSLRVNPASGKPAWELQLFNATGVRVGSVRLAAHDGTLIAVNGLTPNRPAPTPARPLVSTTDADHDTVRPTQVVPGRSTTTTTTTTTYNNVRNPPPVDEDDDRRDAEAAPSSEGGFFSRAGRTLDHTTASVGDSLSRTGQAVNRTMKHTGAKIQRFFTGGESDRND